MSAFQMPVRALTRLPVPHLGMVLAVGASA